jgi:hypothetical protein
MENMTKEQKLVEMEARWESLEKLQRAYPTFEPFLIDCMEDLMGFQCSDIQIDIGEYLEHGPDKLMIQAQRSQAKTTIVAIFAVWCLIHDPKFRVLIISAGSDVATEIANWIVQIIMNWDIMACLRPDRNNGDRASVKAFDVHWALKGAEKSPSVACIGITANMQGRRADLLIPDDVESSKNGSTEIQRQQLVHLTRDFTSICQSGRICFLGTPQTVDSIYTTLPGRGYEIRIWPGRYPTNDQLVHYGDFLAPLLRQRIEADPSLQQGGGPLGDQGQPIDPLLLPEQALTKKELDQGTAYFQLQHMLNTTLTDAEKYPLKPEKLVTMPLSLEQAPGRIDWMPDEGRRVKVMGHPDGVRLYRPFGMSDELYEYEGRLMYVDPAGGGQNGDETVATVTYFLHGYVFLMEQMALPGGYSAEGFLAMSQLAWKHQVNHIEVEENYGKGAYAAMWQPVLQKFYMDEKDAPGCPKIEDINVVGQKELRIVETLEPIMARHRLIVNEDVWYEDIAQCAKYPADMRTVYALWHQLSKLSRERGALIHDDRIDSLAGACRKWLDMISVDEETRMQQKARDHAMEHMEAWIAGGSEEERHANCTEEVHRKVGICRSKALTRSKRRRRRL